MRKISGAVTGEYRVVTVTRHTEQFMCERTMTVRQAKELGLAPLFIMQLPLDREITVLTPGAMVVTLEWHGVGQDMVLASWTQERYFTNV